MERMITFDRRGGFPLPRMCEKFINHKEFDVLVIEMILMLINYWYSRGVLMKNLYLPYILIIVFLLGCLPIVRGMSFRVDDTPLKLKSQPKGE
jgi:hypothetical protein